MPATALISVDLPAPLSPTRAVICPFGMSRSTSLRACTAPKLLVRPRTLNSGWSYSSGTPVRPASAVMLISAEAGRANGEVPRGSVDAVGGAVGCVRPGAQLRRRHEVCLLYTSPSPRDGLLT